jgi:hypothetical protein
MLGKTEKTKSMAHRILSGFLASILLTFVSVICAPQLLAFPHKAKIGATTVYAESPINVGHMTTVLRRSDALLATTGLYRTPIGQRVFLTNGGWRWRVLALNNHMAFAFTRPSSDMVADAAIFNRADPAQDQIFNGVDDSKRSLSGIIAHERTHMLVRRHFGIIRAVSFEHWKSEGYADYVAQESSLTEAEVAAFKKAGVDHWAIPYFEGRQRVAAAMKENGNSVDRLFLE